MGEFKFNIEKHIATLGETGKSWNLELNKVSFNDNEAKYDLRKWDEDHTKMGKGISFDFEEATDLMNSLHKEIANTYFGPDEEE